MLKAQVRLILRLTLSRLIADRSTALQSPCAKAGHLDGHKALALQSCGTLLERCQRLTRVVRSFIIRVPCPPQHARTPCIVPAGTLFACNAYHIGKERCYFKGALQCGFRVFASPARQRTLQRLALPQAWLDLLVDDVSKADVVISDRGVSPPQLASLQEDLGRPIVGFQCTGVRCAVTCGLLFVLL